MSNRQIEIIVGGRQTGRTTKCIEWAAANDAYIVCANQSEVRRIANQAREMNLNIRFPVTFDEAVNRMQGAFPARFAVDNADWFLRYFLERGRHEVGFATWEWDNNGSRS